MSIRLLTEALDNLVQEGSSDLIVQEGFGAELAASSSITSNLTSQTNLGSAECLGVASITAAFTTDIRVMSALLSVSNVLAAEVSTGIYLRAGDVFSIVNSDGSYLVCEGTSDRITTNNEFSGDAAVTANLGIEPRFQAVLEATAAVTPNLLTQINLTLETSAVADTTAALTAAITFAADILSSSNTTADLYVYRVEPVYASRTQRIYLAEIEAYNPATSSTTTWRFASGAGFNHSGTWYDPRIENPATFRREMGGDQSGTKASASYGELTIVNADGGVNGMASQYFDGRTLTLKIGDPSAAYSSFTTILKATIETVAMERERVSVRLRDRSSILDKPFATVKYAGTNTAPNGIEGTADDIKDQPKPRIFGRIALMTPVLVNTSKLIYQVNAGAIDSIVNVFDAGAYLTRAADYASQAAMEATAPIAGTYSVWPAGGCFRLGATAYGQLSVCVVEKWDYTYCTAANIIQRILTEKGLTSADWVSADFTALNQKNAASLGVVVNPDETTASLIDRICQSVGAWWGFDSLNRFRVARFDGPATSPVAVITHDELLSLERETDALEKLWQVTVKSDANYVVQDKKSLAGVVPESRANWFSTASRDQKTENIAVKDFRLLSTTAEEDSLLNGISQAKAESHRRLALLSVRRDTVNMTVVDPAGIYSALDIGDTVLVQTEFLGYDAGRQMVITGIRPDYQRNQLDLKVWG